MNKRTVFARFAQLVEEVSGISADRVEPGMSLTDDIDIEADLLEELASKVEETFGGWVTEEDLEDCDSVEEAVAFIAGGGRRGRKHEVPALVLWAERRKARGDRDGALGYYEEAVRRASKTSPWAKLHDVGAALAADRPKVAVKAYQKALVVDPGAAPSWMGLAGVLAALGERKAAIAAYARALALEPSLDVESTCLNNRADALLRLKRFPEALADIQRCVALGARNLYTRGEVFLAMDMPELAIADFVRARSLSSSKDEDPLLRGAEKAARHPPPHLRIQALLARFQAAPPAQRGAVIDDAARSMSPAEYDGLLEGVGYQARGMLRGGAYWGIFSARPHPELGGTRMLLDFDRYLFGHAPKGTKAAVVRGKVKSLFLDFDDAEKCSSHTDVRDLRSLLRFPALRRLFVRGAGPKDSWDALRELPLESLGLELDGTLRADPFPTLKALPKLKELRLWKTAPPESERLEQQLRTLRHLEVLELDRLHDKRNLAGLKRLRALYAPADLKRAALPAAAGRVLRPRKARPSKLTWDRAQAAPLAAHLPVKG